MTKKEPTPSEEPGVLQKLMTDDTANKQFDIGRVLIGAGGLMAVFGMFAYIVMGVVRAFYADFSFNDWALGFAAIIGAFGALMLGAGALFLMKAKGEGEPE